MTTELHHSSKPPAPALALTCECDEAGALVGRVLDNDALRTHAAAIARTHGTPELLRRAGPLPGLFAQAQADIEAAYAILGAEDRSRVDSISAEEWLLDNRYVVEEQIREIDDDLPRGYLRRLPRVAHGKSARYPRVYAACLDYLLHTDARLDPDSLAAYVEGYQTVHALTIGELWAIPIMLRVGLLVVLSGAARAVTTDNGRFRAAELTRDFVDHPDRVSEILARLEHATVDASTLVHLWRQLREHESSSRTIQWIRDQAAALGASPEELGHRLHLRQAADQLAVANAIASMRTITTYEWSRFFERMSVVETILSRDGGGVYSATDPVCRDRYRHVVERVALRAGLDEAAVANKAIELTRAHTDGARACVGYYLEQEGVHELEHACGARLTARERVARAVTRHPQAFYFTLVPLLTLLVWGLAWRGLRTTLDAEAPVVVLTVLLLIAASEIALSTIGALVVALLPPRVLSRLALEHGITPAHRTLAVVPVLFDSVETVDHLVAELEVRALANPDPDLHFALLSDFCDAEHEEEETDDELVEHATARLSALNDRYPLASGMPKYSLFHRKRVRNDSQGCFMGWERKRGKLEELNRLIVGGGPTTFITITAPPALVSSIQYVITLDADTDLPRTAATHLVATLAHPLNRPVLSADGTRVVHGYAVIQPRVGTVPSSARRTRFARITAGPSALDPYTSAVSDVYQDLFAEGSYIGKAIYDVRAFAAVHDGRTPENRLLSHDLFEGVLARTALASDVELLDEQPESYGIVARRAHRWIRGDWQLLSLFGRAADVPSGRRRGSLGLVGLWKVLDNLRRSLLAPSSVLAFVLAALFWPEAASRVGLVLAVMIAAPVVLRLLSDLLRRGRSRASYDGLWRDSKTTIANAALGALLLVDQSVGALDAVARTLYRLAISKRNLLEWQSTGLDRSGAKTPLRMWLEIPVLAAVVCLSPSVALPIAAPVLVAWMLAPVLVEWLGRPLRVVDHSSELTDDDRRRLRTVARKTWFFFEKFVTEEDHFLPPDNFQEEPRAVVAHRTSPTNMGLYLLSALAARDLGYVGSRELVRRLTATLDTFDQLEKHEGHVLNWYDTKTLQPLEPRYVSTVDSGNLAAYLWAVQRACEEWIERPVLGQEALAGIADALTLAGDEGANDPPASNLATVLACLERPIDSARDGEWAARARETRAAWLEEAERLVPHLMWIRTVPRDLSGLPAFARLRDALDGAVTPASLAEPSTHVQDARDALASAQLSPESRAWLDELFERIARAKDGNAELAAELRRIGERAWQLANGMSFGFLYDTARSLFAIGYNVSTARLDGSRYDLLASEARLASFVAIAKGDVPEKHWFHLGRARCRVDSGRALLSWSGSMFEYLMPLLVMRSYPETLLDETHTAAVGAQRAYAARRGVPWGISEAAFNVMDLSMTYQYRAFGVPALGLKPGLDEDLVIAPYATALTAAVDPRQTVTNFEVLVREGLDGKYGFYDSIDYTPSRVPPNRHGVVVKTYMAHHQGMTLVALTNALLGAPMQRRFHEIPRVRATELLLQERIPAGVALVEERTARGPAPVVHGEDLTLVEVVGLERQGLARVHLLGHGELATTVSSIGTGALTWRGRDISRYREDQRLDPTGTFVYVRDTSTATAWSAGFEPTRARPDSYGATFCVDHVELHRKDGELETTTEIVVSPEHAVEVRRLTLTNHSSRPRELEVLTYMEVVLAPRASDVAHRAFSNMFIELEQDTALPAVLATRRPQPGDDLQPWVVQSLVPESGGWSALQTDTSRGRFIGRGGDVARPRGLQAGADKPFVGHPLDPAITLRRRITLAPKSTARVSLVTGIAPSRDEVLALARAYSGSAPIDRVFELAWADARVELKHLGVSAAQSFRFQRLLSYIVDPHASLRVAPPDHAPRPDGRSALWSLGISGDLPVVIVRVDGGEVTDLCRELLVAHEFFRLNNFSMDLLILNEERAGYLQPLQQELTSLVQTTFAQGQLDQRGGVFLRRASTMDEADRLIVLSSARVVLRTSAGSLARQVRTPLRDAKAPTPAVARPAVRTERPPPPPLVFDNGTGGFTQDGREYVVHGATPAPWSNVLANATFGTLLTERGGGFTWSTNSQRFRLSPWSNDAVADPPGETIYLANDAGDVWRASDGSVRHTAGSSTFEGRTCGVHHTLCVAVPPDAPVKLSKLVLENETDAPVRLRVCGYVEWVLGGTREATRLTTASWWDEALGAAFAQNPASTLAERCSFFRTTSSVARRTCDRAELFADYATRARPSGLTSDPPGRSGGALDPCAALEVDVILPPRGQVALAFVLGDGKDRDEARKLASSWAELSKVDEALERTRERWDEMLGAIQIQTPDPALDLLVNRWLLHQVLACRVWGRSAFYQSGGAFGYRDQLQDVLALLHARPDLAREHLLRAASRQFQEGDVQHWWHPEDGAGIRTRCSDDMLWLVFATLEYLRVTQDEGILDEPVAFLEDRPIPPDQRDVFATPRVSASTAPLYDHCARALDVALTSGPHELPLMRAGDWNDGMDRVGAGGRGESVWLAWFLVHVAGGFEALATARGDGERASKLRDASARLLAAVEQHGWDGAWYRRGYFDDGSALGSSSSAECRIDAIAQSWAVIAGGGDPQRARRAVDSSMEQLVTDDPAAMLLLTPPFEGKGPDPGYIRLYPPGIRENGGQYTHGVLWTVQALAMLGDGERAHALLSKLNPIRHATHAADVQRYAVEPYVVAGDVYASPEHDGRGGWTWYTGAAGWMYRVAVQWLLGVVIEGTRLTLRPCVPSTWTRYSVRLRRGQTIYEIEVEPGTGLEVEVDGNVATDGVVQLVDDGHLHTVVARRRRASQLAG